MALLRRSTFLPMVSTTSNEDLLIHFPFSKFIFKIISILQGKNAFCSNFENFFLTSYPKNKFGKNFLTVAIFYFSSEAAKSMLIRQLFKNAEIVFFLFKKGPLQHRNFLKNFQKFRNFFVKKSFSQN